MPFMPLHEATARELLIELANRSWDGERLHLDSAAVNEQFELIAALVHDEPAPQTQFVRNYLETLLDSVSICEDGIDVCDVSTTDCCNHLLPACQTRITNEATHGDTIVFCGDGFGCTATHSSDAPNHPS